MEASLGKEDVPLHAAHDRNDTQVETNIHFHNAQETLAILGRNDEHLHTMREYFAGKITARGDSVMLSGAAEEVQWLVKLFDELLYVYRSGNLITSHDLLYAIRSLQAGEAALLHQMHGNVVFVTARGRQIKPKTLGQHHYIEAIRNNHITFGIGPAGTGKTYLAVAMAVFSLRNKEVERIVLTRPAIEAGEKLGFLPGDLQDKVDPYLRPLYDALQDILGNDMFQKYMAKNIIEVAPLAYMRGRTLNDSFVILDEAQNTTPQQMKMFLTRLGFGSKMVVTGDVTQIDLPSHSLSGLKQAQQVFHNTPGIAMVTLREFDVVRHEIVTRIIQAYDTYESAQGKH